MRDEYREPETPIDLRQFEEEPTPLVIEVYKADRADIDWRRTPFAKLVDDNDILALRYKEVEGIPI